MSTRPPLPAPGRAALADPAASPPSQRFRDSAEMRAQKRLAELYSPPDTKPGSPDAGVAAAARTALDLSQAFEKEVPVASSRGSGDVLQRAQEARKVSARAQNDARPPARCSAALSRHGRAGCHAVRAATREHGPPSRAGPAPSPARPAAGLDARCPRASGAEDSDRLVAGGCTPWHLYTHTHTPAAAPCCSRWSRWPPRED